MTAVLGGPAEGRFPDRGPKPGVGSVPEAAGSRWHWRNWPVVVKLAAVLLVPTMVALVAGVLRIVDQAGAAPGYARITQIVRAQQQLSGLIGSVARERDLATAFVATGRVGNRGALDEQFRTVDGGVQVVIGALGEVPGLEFARVPLDGLGALAPLRASVTTGFGPVEVVVSEYSAAIDPLIELDSALTRQLDDVAVTNDAAAAHALLAAREQVSRQHAIVLAGLYANRLGPGQIEDLRTATVRLATERDAVRATLEPAERDKAISGIGPDAELSRQRVLQLVLNRGLAGQPLNTSPQDWDQRSAVVVDNTAAVEKGLRQRVEQTAQALLDQVRTTAGVNSVILFFALGLGVLVGILVTRALLRPLSVLKRTALDVADRRLPEAMARIRDGEAPETTIEPVPVGTREEIGQVARAFDEVHSQAVRLASEQAQLRANVNDIFVNLSRRTQGLVERQLKLIDRLESGEQDPQQLDNLFQLDHLATRMRRNSENLLVLAGNEVTNRSGRPVRLIDVLRAAVSEVEQYQRLVLQQPPAVLVLGRTAGDLVHLLAELLDNATQFSPPDSHVMVSSDLAPDGGVAIEVADRGVGMSEEELAEANQRLTNPAAVDASVSRRMGLFVVGRLAGRHGIEVRLRRGDAGVGIWASVVMPSRLVRVAMDSLEPQTGIGPDPTGGEAAGTARPDTNGSVSSSLAAALQAGRGGVPVPRPHAETDSGAPAGQSGAAGGPDADDEVAAEPIEAAAEPVEAGDERTAGREGDAEQTGNDGEPAVSGAAISEPGVSESGICEPGVCEPGVCEPGTETDPPAAAQPGPDPLTASALPKRTGKRPVPPAEPIPAPPGPPAAPSETGSAQSPGEGSDTELFRPARPSVPGPAGPVGPVGPARSGQRVTLQHSTPIFDDVASAWFKAHEAVPVRWSAPPARGAGAKRETSAQQAPSPDAPLPDAPAADITSAGAAPADAAPKPALGPAAVPASGTVGAPPLTRRQPGKTLAEPESRSAGQPGPAGQPVAAPENTRTTPASGWGAGDEGWRAAEALAQPVSAEVTAMGLPRRQPRALLIPGAAGIAEPTSAPSARSAESVRGRLASYQQGIREGRQARASFQQSANGSQQDGSQQDGEEAST